MPDFTWMQIASAVIVPIAASFFKINDVPVWKKIKDSLWPKPPSTPTPSPVDQLAIPPFIAAILGPMIQQLLQKKPVTIDPKNPIVVPTDGMKFLEMLNNLTRAGDDDPSGPTDGCEMHDVVRVLERFHRDNPGETCLIKIDPKTGVKFEKMPCIEGTVVAK
jgi:hypothetical protein